MLRLALGQLRARPVAFVGSAAVLVGCLAALTQFTSLLVAGIEGPPTSGEQVGLVAVGGAFGEIVVVVSLLVAGSATGLAVHEQRRELALLRATGATPRQVRALVRREALVLVLVCAPPGWLLGRQGAAWFLHEAVARGLAPAGDRIPAAPVPAAIALVVTALIAAAAATAAAWRVARLPVSAALVEVRSGAGRISPARVGAGLAALGGGVALCLVVAHAEPADALDGSLLAALALLVAVALLAPLLTLLVTTTFGMPLAVLWPRAGWLAWANLRGYSVRAASAVLPVALLVGLTWTFELVTAAAHDAAGAGGLGSIDSPTDRWLRAVELAVLASFGAVACVQSLAAMTAGRRSELALLGLTGATRRQLLASVGIEAALVALTGVAAGAVVGTAVAWSVAHALPGARLPEAPTGTCVLAVLAALVLTALGTGPAAVWAVVRTPAGGLAEVAAGER